jgi:putative membrane protein
LNDKSTNEYIDKVVKRYSKLFSLPSHSRVLIYLALLSLHGGLLSIFPLNISMENLAGGLGFGLSFLVLTLISDFIVSHTAMKNDPIFTIRRCWSVCFFSSLVWLAVLIVGGLTAFLVGNSDLWLRFFFLGLSGALILRLLVLSVTSFAGFWGNLFSSLLQPTLASIPICFMGSTVGYFLETRSLLFVAVSISATLLSVAIFKYSMDRVGTGSLGIASSTLFKAFLANWTEGLIAPLESFFEKLGNLQDIKVSLLIFRTAKKIKAVFVVPALHPGPFKNLGSSLLPSMIQTTMQDKFDCVVSVPHGLVGHELDVASQYQTKRVVQNILGFLGTASGNSKATNLVRTQSSDAKASCQVFGDYAFITLTNAPKTMEDLPPELDSFITEEAKKRGFGALVIDAHNSMSGPFDVENAVKSFSEASVNCLEKASVLHSSSFKVGAVAVVPEEWTIHDGMGPGGISVVVIEVDTQKVAYVTIDGNNMISGLRDEILLALKELGINDGEVLTTDTHSVCGMIRSTRGYNLVGEAIDHLRLISYIKEAAVQALGNMESAVASWSNEVIPDVKVIGEQRIMEFTVLADQATERVKRVSTFLFPGAAILLTLLLLLIL